MGYGPQQIRPHGFLFRVHKLSVLFPDEGGLTGDHDADAAGKAGDKGHPKKRERIAAECKIQLHIRHTEGKINPKDAVEGGNDARAVEAGGPGVEDDSQNVYKGYIDQVIGEMEHKGGNEGSCRHVDNSSRQGADGFQDCFFYMKGFPWKREVEGSHVFLLLMAGAAGDEPRLFYLRRGRFGRRGFLRR